MTKLEPALLEILSHFQIPGICVKAKRNTQGHINDTFISTFDENGVMRKYTHQRINKNVFHHPDEVMENIVSVTKHIQNKVSGYRDADKRVLHVIPAIDGKNYFIDSEGEYWRTYVFIEGVSTYDTIENEKLAYQLGSAIGTFQLQLSDFDGKNLHTTIPHFHDMGLRYTQLMTAVKNDSASRLALVQAELTFLLDNRERGLALWDGFASGHLPSRVTHNDTKMNNVLFSEDGSEALCVIDLDTIMPGTILFDTGDMIRTACNSSGEDEKDSTKVQFQVPLYKALISGYKDKASGFLTKGESALIKESGRIITQIMAVRFLADYLAGDVYYHTEYPEHNLVRARTQIALMQSMDAHWSEF